MGCGASKSHDHGLLKESELKIGTNSLNDKEIVSTKGTEQYDSEIALDHESTEDFNQVKVSSYAVFIERYHFYQLLLLRQMKYSYIQILCCK